MKRYAGIVEADPAHLAEYERLHANAWPGVLRMIKRCNIQNYSIYKRKLNDGKIYLFSYFEYVGDDFEKDMAMMADDAETQRWWSVCKPLLKPLPDREPGEFWAGMKEIFYEA